MIPGAVPRVTSQGVELRPETAQAKLFSRIGLPSVTMARHVRQLTVADSSVRISTELSGMATEMLFVEKEVRHVELSGGRNSPRSDLLDPISGLACAVAE
jgi:hypothetical protein